MSGHKQCPNSDLIIHMTPAVFRTKLGHIPSKTITSKLLGRVEVDSIKLVFENGQNLEN